MRHVVLDRWSRGTSAVHRSDPRAKLLVLIVFLVTLATAQRGLPWFAGELFLLLAGGFFWAQLPLLRVLGRAGLVLPFTLVFALISWLGGDAERAVSLSVKSYLSTLAVLLVISTTPLPALLRGLQFARVPSFLLAVGQFLYRYLFIIADEARSMGDAAASRGAPAWRWRSGGSGLQAAGGALAVLFARSYGRAEQIHNAMLARGFAGRYPTLEAAPLRRIDAVAAIGASITLVALRIIAGGITP